MKFDGDDVEQTINGLIKVKSEVIRTISGIDRKKYHDNIDSLFRTIHTFKAHISYMDLDEISSVLEKSEDIMTFLKNNDCILCDDVSKWFYLFQEQCKIWIDELSLLLDNWDTEEFDGISFYSDELDNSPHVFITEKEKNKRIESHRIVILTNDKKKSILLENELGNGFKNITTSDNITHVTKLIKSSDEPLILISDIKLRDGSIADIINNQLVSDIHLIIYSSISEDRIEKIKSILKTKNVLNSETHSIDDILKLSLKIVSEDNTKLIKIPLNSTNIPLEKLTKSLKPLPEVIHKISEMCFDEESKINELSSLIEQDVVVSGKLLKHINSPYYGLPNTITSIQQAVVLLGKKRTYAATINGLTDELIPDVDLSMYEINQSDVIKINRIRSSLLYEWCKEIGMPYKTIETLNTMLLVSVLGTFLTAKAIDSNLQYTRFKTIKNTDELYIIEKQLLGYSSYDVISRLFSAWKFPEIFIWIAKELPTYKLEHRRQPSMIKIFSFIISIICKVVRIDGTFNLDIDTQILMKQSGYDTAALQIAWQKVFGELRIGHFNMIE